MRLSSAAASGDSMAAHRLLHAGWQVLLLERGDRVERGPHCSEALRDPGVVEAPRARKRLPGGCRRLRPHGVRIVSLPWRPLGLLRRSGDPLPRSRFPRTPEIAGLRRPLAVRLCRPRAVLRAGRAADGRAGDDAADKTRPTRSAAFPSSRRRCSACRPGSRRRCAPPARPRFRFPSRSITTEATGGRRARSAARATRSRARSAPRTTWRPR